MSYTKNKRRLSIMFRALDLEGKTKPVPCVVCPEHADLMPVGSCGRCGRFRRIEFTEHGFPVLNCVSHDVDSEGVNLTEPWSSMQDVLRVPLLCVAEDTPAEVMRPFLGLGDDDEVIPVLDARARPVGLVMLAKLREQFRGADMAGVLVTSLASTATPHVSIDMRLADVRAMFASSKSRRVFVVARDGTFLGMVAERDLMPHHA